MEQLRKIAFTMPRHRKFQIVITTGAVVSNFIAWVLPQYNEIIIVSGLVTNIIWIWE